MKIKVEINTLPISFMIKLYYLKSLLYKHCRRQNCKMAPSYPHVPPCYLLYNNLPLRVGGTCDMLLTKKITAKVMVHCSLDQVIWQW